MVLLNYNTATCSLMVMDLNALKSLPDANTEMCPTTPRRQNQYCEESNRSNDTKKGSFAEKKEYGVMEEAGNNESVQDHQTSNGGRNSRSSTTSGSYNGPHLETYTFKSNLKKTTATVGENLAGKDHQKKKVSWPDVAHGTDIAHVLEFEPR
ncbi:unnamed protein product [Dovyalis caffra]|uniref:Uncharacterized protein n=1 Tax=Dovyalis caffra TaxID=77055 RepID=A0AAV1RJK9_9ROSI|nr:unnamed protein product [Dovyalis caffra]